MAYLADILQQLNKVNLKPHGTLSAFVEKLDDWKRKAQAVNFAMFEIVPWRLLMKSLLI